MVLSGRKIALGLVVVVLGCGGGGGGSSATSTSGTGGGLTGGSSGGQTDAAFVGAWTGPWHETNGPERSGTMTIAIARTTPSDDHLTISGTVHNAAGGDGTVVGSIADANGAWTLGFELAATGAGYSGIATLASGHLVGPLNTPADDGGVHLNVDFDLSPVR